MSELYLVFNAGSSSIKCGLFEMAPPGGLVRLLREQIDGIGSEPGAVATEQPGDETLGSRWARSTSRDHAEAVRILLEWVDSQIGGRALSACGHRVVHGGALYGEPVLVTSEVLSELERLTPLAPLHQPHSLAGIRAIQNFCPSLPQAACFDTAFHSTQPRLARLFGLPHEITDRGVYRYGFHGLSYEYIASVLPRFDPVAADGRTVVAHLGHGASLCALRAGQSIATTMGFSTLDGLPMGTRCGALDPAVVFHLMNEFDMTASNVEKLLYERSGLLGVSGLSADIRVLRERGNNARAAEAIDLFVYRTVREISGLIGALGGIDALVFTAGIGENDAALRADILRALSWLEFDLDEPANKRGGPLLTRGPGPRGWIIPTDEEFIIAHHTRSIARGVSRTSPQTGVNRRIS
jgi:acetate kinase